MLEFCSVLTGVEPVLTLDTSLSLSRLEALLGLFEICGGIGERSCGEMILKCAGGRGGFGT